MPAAVTDLIHPSIEAAVLKDVPITMKRPPPPPDELAKTVPNFGMPRANRVISKECPQGSPTSPPNASAIQQHVLWFDFNGDGKIMPWETYQGFRKLGFGYIISLLAVPFIHGSFSFPTSPGWIPHPLMPIYIERMHKTKHGSDSEVYDTEGRFVPQKFEEIFSKYDKENKGALSWRDIQEMVYGNANINDPVGWIAERLEWFTLYLLCKDERGLVTKEKIRAQYDGSLWAIIAKEVELKKSHAQQGKVGSYQAQKEVAKLY
ncbi:hypothetical protein QJQ45_025980 [Haematococcus lacustris]|nr:hypothetical protein QJQ45_025980 [Haematococcus lacustris]